MAESSREARQRKLLVQPSAAWTVTRSKLPKGASDSSYPLTGLWLPTGVGIESPLGKQVQFLLDDYFDEKVVGIRICFSLVGGWLHFLGRPRKTPSWRVVCNSVVYPHGKRRLNPSWRHGA